MPRCSQKDHVAVLRSLLVERKFLSSPQCFMDLLEPLITLVLHQTDSEELPRNHSHRMEASEFDKTFDFSSEKSVEERRTAVKFVLIPRTFHNFFVALWNEAGDSPPLPHFVESRDLLPRRQGDEDPKSPLVSHKRSRQDEEPSCGCGSHRFELSMGTPRYPFRLLMTLLEEAEVFATPFSGDAAYLQNMEAFFAIQYKCLMLDKLLTVQHNEFLRNHNIDILQHLLPIAAGLQSLFEHFVQRRAERMEKPPRVLRLARRLELSPKEENALAYLAVAQSGSVLPLVLDHMYNPAQLAHWNHMTPTELYEFIRDDRIHMQQGLVVISEITSLAESKVMLPQEAAAVLCGIEATHDQMAKLEKTALGDILLEEGVEERVPGPKRCKMDVEEEDEDEDEEEAVNEDPEADDVASVDSKVKSSTKEGSGQHMDLKNTPYRNNFECMEGAFQLISLMIKIRNMEGDIKEEEEQRKRKRDEAVIRGMEGKLRIAQNVHTSRVQATMNSGAFIPAIEALSTRFHLSELEKYILLLMVGNAISHDVLVAINGRYFMREGQRFITVGYIIFVLCKGLQQRVEARQAFYRSSRLIANSILSISVEPSNSRSCFNTDLMEYVCDIDRKIVDLLMGRETESQEMVPGSSVIVPSVSLDKVVLPRTIMDKVLSRVEHFNLVDECKKKCGFGIGLGDSVSGLVILFYGPSGTGKTMLAHAVAKEMNKKLLLVNVSAFKGSVSAPEMMRFVFREAKLRDAIIFFDECEDLFSTRTDNPALTTLLVEFEKYDGLILMATNAAQCFDESMNRRITLMIEFKPPDHSMRHEIWLSHIPPGLNLSADVSLERLALNYELTGGLIRNAVLAAISNAVAREKSSTPTLLMEDFETGAKQQLRGFFMAAGDATNRTNYLTPRRRLDELVLDAETKSKLEQVAKLSKSRATLFSLWGFNEENAPDQGSIYLFHGSSGTGKSMAAEGIAYECGLTIRVCNATYLLRRTDLSHIATVFEEAQKLGAMVVIEEAQCFFQHSVDEAVVGIIVYHALRHSKPVILLATTEQQSFIDLKRHQFPITLIILFNLPRKNERMELWRQVFPSNVPLEKHLDLGALSDYPMTAKQIERTAFHVCCQAALLPADARLVSMEMIRTALEEEMRREQARKSTLSMYV